MVSCVEPYVNSHDRARSYMIPYVHSWSCKFHTWIHKIGVEIYEKNFFIYYVFLTATTKKAGNFHFEEYFFGQKILCCKLLGHQFYIVLCKNETYPTSGTLRKQGLSFLQVYIWSNAWSCRIMHELARILHVPTCNLI